MTATYFLYWLKGYLGACEVEGATYSRDHIDRIQTVLELALKAQVPDVKADSVSNTNTFDPNNYKLYQGPL